MAKKRKIMTKNIMGKRAILIKHEATVVIASNINKNMDYVTHEHIARLCHERVEFLLVLVYSRQYSIKQNINDLLSLY